MAENVSNLGYIALSKETTPGTVAATPSVFVPLFDENIQLDTGLTADGSAFGSKAKTYQVLPGRRSFTGDITVVAEPNTAAHFFNMLLTQGAATGSGPYTHPFTLSSTTPKTYTVDIAKGPNVFRYSGVSASDIGIAFKENEMQLKVKVSALKAFTGRDIASISTTSVTLASSYSDWSTSPTDGLVAGDNVIIIKADGTSSLSTTISSITNATTVVVGTSAAAFSAGDQFFIAPSTPSLSVVTPFQWARTQFCFGATASAALSAAHTPLESSSEWHIMHEFNDNKGEWRSGSYSPASLARKLGSYTFKLKQYYDGPPNLNLSELQKNAKVACVIRHYSESGYELRITLNNFKLKSVVPSFKVDEILYSDMEATGQYDSSDAQMFDVKVINNLATV